MQIALYAGIYASLHTAEEAKQNRFARSISVIPFFPLIDNIWAMIQIQVQIQVY